MFNSIPSEASIKAQIASLSEKAVLSMVEGYAELVKSRVQKSCKEIANKCYEAVVVIKTKKATGYGRTPQEAVTNSIRKLAEVICED